MQLVSESEHRSSAPKSQERHSGTSPRNRGRRCR